MLLLRSENDPDEAPRNPSTQADCIQLFVKLELVVIILVSLPVGYSPFSPCERQMAPLSKQLTTVILDHKHYGSYLDSSTKTVDVALERQNFEHAETRLAGFFSAMVLDGQETFAQCVKPPENINHRQLSENDKHVSVTEEWVCDHTSFSKCCLQIICCDNERCCPNRPSHVKLLLRPLMPNGFLPPPVKLCQKFQDSKA